MKRKVDEKERLDPMPLDLMMAKVTRPAKSRMRSHQSKVLSPFESRVDLGAARKCKEDEEEDTNPSKLDLDSLPLDLKPAKSLMKFRCVSKMWYSIIRSRGFIDSYFSMSSKQSRFIVALSNGLFNKIGEKLIFFFSFSHEGEESESESSSLVPTFEMAMPSVSFSFNSGSCTSLHGFLALGAVGQKMLCNPNTEQFTTVPDTTCFVGYDPIDNQYKSLCFDFDCRYPSVDIEHKVLTLGDGKGWRHIKSTHGPYSPLPPNICISGFLYYGAYSLSSQTKDPLVVCFDVRSEQLSFIKAPNVVLQWKKDAVFIDYKGKLASIVRDPYCRFTNFDLWILEDPKTHKWSKKTCVFPFSLWDYVGNVKVCFPGTTKAGEIIIAPQKLSLDVRPLYIFYYSLDTKKMRRVRLLGIGDDQEFRRSYGFVNHGDCLVRIAPQHIESIAFLKDL